MNHHNTDDLEAWLAYLEQVPYQHQRAVNFLSYLYHNPKIVSSYPEIIGLALTLINQSSHEVTDEPPIYAYQSAALMSHFILPSLPEWKGIPAGELNRVAWLIMQYYPRLSESDKSDVQRWAVQQLEQQAQKHSQWAADTTTIIQHLAHHNIGSKLP